VVVERADAAGAGEAAGHPMLLAGFTVAVIGHRRRHRLADLLEEHGARIVSVQGVRAVPQDFLNVGRVLKLSRWKMLTKILIPATLPYMFTGFRLSLGIAWLVIVAAEMLTGRPGAGGFLWQEYNSLIFEHIILSIITIGVVGFVLDRLMGLLERRFKTA